MEKALENRIRELALRLESRPPVQFPPSDGLPGEPGGVLIQRRCADVKINPGGSERLKLFHKRFVLTAALKQEGLVCVSLAWIAMSFLGCLPFVLSGAIPDLVDALFETVSGFTTTGATILPQVEVLSRSCMFWRMFTQ